ncbi:hypothetical protein GCK32_019232, partial [Trichostrongylus colubriformis]
MGLYDENQLRNGVPVPTGTVPKEKGRAQALLLATQLFAGEGTRIKFLFILSDGAASTCSVEKPSQTESELMNQ